MFYWGYSYSKRPIYFDNISIIPQNTRFIISTCVEIRPRLWIRQHIDGLEQDHVIANALKLLQFCTKPSTCNILEVRELQCTPGSFFTEYAPLSEMNCNFRLDDSCNFTQISQNRLDRWGLMWKGHMDSVSIYGGNSQNVVEDINGFV